MLNLIRTKEEGDIVIYIMDADTFNRCLKKIKIDKKAFEQIYRFYYPRIVLHINNKFRFSNLSQDVAHEFFKKLLETEVTQFVLKPTAWVYTICDNIMLNILKREQKLVLTDNLENFLKSSENYIDNFSIENALISLSLKQHLSNFDEITQKIFYLYICEGYNLKDIAFLVQLNYETVKKKFSRATKKLSEMSPKSPF